MDEMDANDFGKERLLRITHNDRRKRGVIAKAIA